MHAERVPDPLDVVDEAGTVGVGTIETSPAKPSSLVGLEFGIK